MLEALFMIFLLDSKGAKGCKSDRSRQELSNEYLLAKIGVDTAENERASQSSFNFQVMSFNFHRAAPPEDIEATDLLVAEQAIVCFLAFQNLTIY